MGHWQCSVDLIPFWTVLSLSWLNALGVGALHAVSFENYCGFGVPTLDLPPSNTVATGVGNNVYQNGSILAYVAFLNTGYCGPNGGNCTVVDINLGESDGDSSAVVDLIPNNVFNVPVGFSYYNACNGAGDSCLNANCANAIRNPGETNGVVNCSAAADPNGVASLLVTFCPNLASTSSSSSSASSTVTSSTYSSTQYSSTTSSSSASVSTGPTNTSSSNHSTPVGAIAGGVVGGVVGLIVIVVAIFLLRRRARRIQEQRQQEDIETKPEPFISHPTSPVVLDKNPPVAQSGASSPSVPFSRPPFLPNVSYTSTVTPSSSASQPSEPHLRPLPRPLPTPTTLAPATISASTVPLILAAAPPISSEVDLDGIVERLASRFGWTSPSADVDNDPLPTYHDVVP